MATHYYYKEVVDPDDSSKVTPILLDDLLLPKDNLSEDANVPKEKETGYRDGSRDISNLFRMAEDLKYPTAATVGIEATNYHIEKSSAYYITPKVSDVTKSHAWAQRLHTSSSIPANKSFTVPSQYRERWMFYSVYYRAFGGVHGYQDHSGLLGGGFIKPGTTTVNVMNPYIPDISSNADHYMDVRLHEVQYTEWPDQVDLNTIFVGRDSSNISDKWWKPLLFRTITGQCQNNGGEHDGNRTRTVSGLPSGSFTYKVFGMYHGGGSSGRANLWKGNTVKPSGDLSISYNVTQGAMGVLAFVV